MSSFVTGEVIEGVVYYVTMNKSCEFEDTAVLKLNYEDDFFTYNIEDENKIKVVFEPGLSVKGLFV